MIVSPIRHHTRLDKRPDEAHKTRQGKTPHSPRIPTCLLQVDSDTVSWWHMDCGRVLGVNDGRLIEYCQSTLAPLGLVVGQDQLKGKRVVVVSSAGDQQCRVDIGDQQVLTCLARPRGSACGVRMGGAGWMPSCWSLIPLSTCSLLLHSLLSPSRTSCAFSNTRLRWGWGGTGDTDRKSVHSSEIALLPQCFSETHPASSASSGLHPPPSHPSQLTTRWAWKALTA